MRESYRQMISFGIIGVVNTGFDLALLNLFLGLLGERGVVFYPACKILSSGITAISSYFLNRRFTFDATGKRREPVLFVLVTGTSILLNGLTASIVFRLLLEGNFLVPVASNIGALVGVAVNMTTNFLGYKYVVFR